MNSIQAHMKITFVTGANKGIGREVAHQLAAKGFHVFIGARNRSAGRKAADEIGKKGGEATFLEIDVSDNNSVAAAAREFAKASDHLDVLVNNAGIIVDGDDAILEINDELLRKTLETNALGALRVMRACVPLLAKSETPRVINVSSGGGQLIGGADGWAPAARHARCTKARIRLCGLLPKRRRSSLGNSCVTAKKFRGELERMSAGRGLRGGQARRIGLAPTALAHASLGHRPRNPNYRVNKR